MKVGGTYEPGEGKLKAVTDVRQPEGQEAPTCARQNYKESVDWYASDRGGRVRVKCARLRRGRSRTEADLHGRAQGIDARGRYPACLDSAPRRSRQAHGRARSACRNSVSPSRSATTTAPAPLTDGTVPIDGVDPVFMALDPEEIFFRAFRHAEFDICELSLSSSTVKTAQGDFAYVGRAGLRVARVPPHLDLCAHRPREEAGRT